MQLRRPSTLCHCTLQFSVLGWHKVDEPQSCSERIIIGVGFDGERSFCFKIGYLFC